MSGDALQGSRALWNRTRADLRSDEIVAQLLDRGELAAWRELRRVAAQDPTFRARLHAIVRRVPLAYPGFWLVVLEGLGETVDWSAALPEDDGV